MMSFILVSSCGLACAPKGIREQGREPLVQERLNEQPRLACNVNSWYSCMLVLQQSYMHLSVIQLILFVECVHNYCNVFVFLLQLLFSYLWCKCLYFSDRTRKSLFLFTFCVTALEASVTVSLHKNIV